METIGTGGTEPSKVPVFFYGSFINRDVLARGGLVADSVEVGMLWGYDIRIATLANLTRSARCCVYGIVCEATHAELAGLYGQDWLGGAYLPEPVIVALQSGRLGPALCYIAPTLPPARPDADYIDRIVGPARDYGFPDWYIGRLESFRARG